MFQIVPCREKLQIRDESVNLPFEKVKEYVMLIRELDNRISIIE
jgi:hypothetical protein